MGEKLHLAYTLTERERGGTSVGYQRDRYRERESTSVGYQRDRERALV